MKVSATEIKVGLESKRDSPRAQQVREYPATSTMSGPPLDASGTWTWKLVHFLARQRPSAQEGRGDGRLDAARQLARDNQEFISPSHLENVRWRISL